MLRRLVLMRHAKSSPAIGRLPDHQRPLEDVGISDAHRVARKLHKAQVQPDLVLCSDAKRTLDTWLQVAQVYDFEGSFTKSHNLYESDVSSYEEEIRSQDSHGKCLMLIGHNPTLEQFIYILAGKSIEMKPSYAAILEIHAKSWDEAVDQRGQWKLTDVIKC